MQSLTPHGQKKLLPDLYLTGIYWSFLQAFKYLLQCLHTISFYWSGLDEHNNQKKYFLKYYLPLYFKEF